MTEPLPNIPGYSLLRRLGRGGMAEVFLATQESLHRQVAIKVLRAGSDPAFAERFIKEAHIVASLHHPAIITIYDIGRLDDGRPYLTMEYVPGGDLSQFKGSSVPAERALSIIRTIAEGLAVVHAKGLLHRDVKPANILFRADGSAVLSDFGIAKELALDSDLTQVGIAVGSPAYSSPEQTQCRPLDARSDIYSLGVILYELLTGQNPFRGDNYTQTVINQLQMPIPHLPQALSHWQPLLERMLAKAPGQRFTDCSELLRALHRQTAPAELDATLLQPKQPAAKARSPLEGQSARPKQTLLWALIATTVLATGTAGGLYFKKRMAIKALLEQAEQQLALGQLVSPEQNNAHYFFTQVLAQDRNNATARKGLERVKAAQIGEFLVLAEQRLAEQRLYEPPQDNANYYFQQALNLDPNQTQARQGLERVQQTRIALQLERAEQHWQAKQLIAPEGNNALADYRQILEWQADQAEALAGLERLTQHFQDQAALAYRRSNFPLALQMIKQGLEVNPEHPGLKRLLREHQQLLAGARKARQASAAHKPAATAESVESPKATEDQPTNPIKRVWNNLFGN